jgi:prephenate dehydrogenase
MPSPERLITLYGPGLLGGSLALAIQQRFPQTCLRLWARRPEAEDGIRARGITAEFTTDARAAAQGASLLILCTPVETMATLAAAIQSAPLAADAIVTDVGSVKASVVSALQPLLGHAFIGSHPMAGSEKTGIETARADLFEGAACLLTPVAETAAEPMQRLRDFWMAMGCHLLEMSPAEHDVKVARISHLPHFMAAVTTLAALRGDVSALKCAAGGFRDSTRVAAGDPGLWSGIGAANQQALISRLEEAQRTLAELLLILRSGQVAELQQFLAEAQALRKQL